MNWVLEECDDLSGSCENKDVEMLACQTGVFEDLALLPWIPRREWGRKLNLQIEKEFAFYFLNFLNSKIALNLGDVCKNRVGFRSQITWAHTSAPWPWAKYIPSLCLFPQIGVMVVLIS